MSTKSQGFLIKIDQPNWLGQREHDRVFVINHPSLTQSKVGRKEVVPTIVILSFLDTNWFFELIWITQENLDSTTELKSRSILARSITWT